MTNTTTSFQCYLCGNTEGVQEENILTLAGTVKNVGMCMSIKDCNARMVKAVQEKALAGAKFRHYIESATISDIRAGA